MARILAIDTTGEFGSLALWEGDALREEVTLHSPEGFGHVLFDHIARLLQRHAIEVPAVDCFASASGPGSFTGVRVGLTAAKGLAEACGRPMVAVSNLQALAWYGTAASRAVFVDARRGEIYGAVYSSALEVVCDERVMKFPEWLESLPSGELEYITPDPTIYPSVGARPASRALAGAVAAIAAREFAAGRAMDPAGADANYVRRADAELLWRDR
jgi:tRNA threonylcarbamoyladenosine biosynthesis protein TsaB